MLAIPPYDSEHLDVIVIGGGQAGLSASCLLKQKGVDHVVLEKNRVAHAWRSQRWDTFCLVTPNWQCQLPDFAYTGDDPKGFMLKDEIVAYVESFADSFDAPVHEGVAVRRLAPRPEGGFEVLTNQGRLTSNHVIVAIGGYHDPIIPPGAQSLPDDIFQLHSVDYRNPRQLPDGGVLVVGSGQSGTQIAEDLHLAGRDVHLCVGNAPRVNRRYRGKDVVEWLDDMGYYDLPYDKHPQGDRVRAKTNHYVTGRDGGRDIDLRQRALEGVKLYGKLESVSGTTVRLAPDLANNLEQADATARRIRETIDEHIARHGIDAPTEPPYVAPWTPDPDQETPELDLTAHGITTVLWSIGFKPNFRWINADLIDPRGYPRHRRGVTDVDGLYFLGLPWQHTWGSGRFSGVARDAEHLVEKITAHKPAEVNA